MLANPQIQLMETTPRPNRSRQTKTYYFPVMDYHHKQIVLCEHSHRTLETAQKCLGRRRKDVEVLINDPTTPKRKLNRVADICFYVREVTLRKAYALDTEIDHKENSSNPKLNFHSYHGAMWIPSYHHSALSPLELKALIDKDRNNLGELVDLHIPKPLMPKAKEVS